LASERRPGAEKKPQKVQVSLALARPGRLFLEYYDFGLVQRKALESGARRITPAPESPAAYHPGRFRFVLATHNGRSGRGVLNRARGSLFTTSLSAADKPAAADALEVD